MIYATNDYLAHYGKLGQKWGIRRYQNEDGSLTPLGEERYRKKQARDERRQMRKSIASDAKALSRLRGDSKNTMTKHILDREGHVYTSKVIRKATVIKKTRTAVKSAAVIGAAILSGKIVVDAFKKVLSSSEFEDMLTIARTVEEAHNVYEKLNGR